MVLREGIKSPVALINHTRLYIYLGEKFEAHFQRESILAESGRGMVVIATPQKTRKLRRETVPFEAASFRSIFIVTGTDGRRS